MGTPVVDLFDTGINGKWKTSGSALTYLKA